MKRKMITCLIVMAFACSSLLLTTSCAKKEMKAWSKKAFTTKKAGEAVEGEAAAPVSGRDARMQELEKARMIAEEMRIFETTNVYFDFDRSDLKAEAQDVLKKKANWLDDNPRYSLRIMGHCDERGTAEYNLALGERRAHAAKKFLMALGISGDRVYTISYGEEKPDDPGHSEAAWSQNRRDDFLLIK